MTRQPREIISLFDNSCGCLFPGEKSRCYLRDLCRYNGWCYVEEQRYIYLPFNAPLNNTNPSKLWFITLKMTTATLSETSENYRYFTWPNSAGQSYFCFHFFFFHKIVLNIETNLRYLLSVSLGILFLMYRHIWRHTKLTSLDTDYWSAPGSTDMYGRYSKR